MLVISGLLLFFVGQLLSFRYLWSFIINQGASHFESIILWVLRSVGYYVLIIGFLANLSGVNHRILEEITFRLRKAEIPNAETDSEQRTFSHRCPFLFTLVVV